MTTTSVAGGCSLSVSAIKARYRVYVSVIVCIFFFQAEDGIRDLTVTGVQTCALPILFPSLRRKSTPPGPILELYLIESAKNDSSATMRLLRSDFIAATRSASSPSGVIAAAATTPFCTTGTGLDRFVLVPSPSCPSPLDPQQYAAPLGVTPQVCRPPALTATNGRPPATGTGLDWLVRSEEHTSELQSQSNIVCRLLLEKQ